MNKQLKQQMLLIFFGVALFAALTYLNEVAGFFRVLAGILSPVVSGLLLAFVLSVPMLGIARRLTTHFPKMKEKTVDFGKDPIAKILFRLAPPVMLAQLIQALYNIVDSFFVGRNSESGRTRKGELARLGGAAEQLRRRHHGANEACGLVRLEDDSGKALHRRGGCDRVGRRSGKFNGICHGKRRVRDCDHVLCTVGSAGAW